MATKATIDVSLIIPTYLRPLSLVRCLNSVNSSQLMPREVIVVYRYDDFATSKELEKYADFNVIKIPVSNPGQIHAISKGVERSGCEFIFIIDDDVEVDPLWLSRALVHLENPNVGAVGGRDYQPADNGITNENEVGIFKYYGRLIGNHHRGIGKPRNVDFLKGCNFIMRNSIALQINPIFLHLYGEGAQVGNDLVMTITSRVSGFETIYDPEMKVIHHVEQRPEGDKRDSRACRIRQDASCNLWMIKLTYSSRLQCTIIVLYGVLVGDSYTPGLLKSLLMHKFKVEEIVKDMKRNIQSLLMVWKIARMYSEKLPPRENLPK